MRHNNIPASATQINNLIALAQTAPNEEIRSKAINTLWDYFGKLFVAVLAKKSYQVNSDFFISGCTPTERQEYLMGDAFIVFYEVVMNFDLNRKVPFAAFISKKSDWVSLDEKRRNAKRTNREKPESYLQKQESETFSHSIDNCDTNPFTGNRNIQECESENEEIMEHIRSCIGVNDSKLLHKFDAMYEVSCEGDYSDADAGRALGCTRANVGVAKKKMHQLLVDNGLEEECRLLMAA